VAGTDFPESVKLEARKRAAFKCCYCRERMGDEVHHLVPKERDGQGVIDNAILLCAQCHTDYGNNPVKQRQLRQARDDWHEIVARRYSKSEINHIEQVATKDDIGQIVAELRQLTGFIEASLRTGKIDNIDAANVTSAMVSSLVGPSKYVAAPPPVNQHAPGAIIPVQISGSNVRDFHIYSSPEQEQSSTLILLKEMGFRFDRPPVDVNPPELDWLQLEERFRRIPGEVEAIWSYYESGLVEWSVYARGGDEKRTVERFLNEARIAGRKTARLNIPRKFPTATFTDAADHWLNVVAALVHPATDVSGSGIDERGRSESGAIDKLVEASQIACARLLSES
jgi:hypothetical protein